MLNIDTILQDDVKFCVFDVETAHLNLLTQNYPWQLGFILCEGSKILEKYNKYIWWDNLKVSKEAARITQFDDNKYKNLAEPNNAVLTEFEKYLYDESYIILGTNLLQFDVYIHNIWRKALGKETDYSYINRIIDINALAKGIKTNQKYKLGENFLAYQYRMLNFKQKGLKTNLTQLVKDNEITEVDVNTLHDGLNDVIATFLVWNKWIKYNFVY